MAAGSRQARVTFRRRRSQPVTSAPPKAVRPGLAAIPTVHSGVLMRSRLEARWATVLDVLGLEWSYEPEIFRLGRGKGSGYLPDFRLDGLDTWLEVKGPHWERFDKTQALARRLGARGLVLVGTASGVCWRVPPSGGRPVDTEVHQGRCHRCRRTAVGVPDRRTGKIGCRGCGGQVEASGVFGW